MQINDVLARNRLCAALLDPLQRVVHERANPDARRRCDARDNDDHVQLRASAEATGFVTAGRKRPLVVRHAEGLGLRLRAALDLEENLLVRLARQRAAGVFPDKVYGWCCVEACLFVAYASQS